MSNSRKFFRVATEEEVQRMTPWQYNFYAGDRSIVGLDAVGRIKVADMSPWIIFTTVLVTQKWLEHHAQWLDWRDEYLAAAELRVLAEPTFPLDNEEGDNHGAKVTPGESGVDRR